MRILNGPATQPGRSAVALSQAILEAARASNDAADRAAADLRGLTGELRAIDPAGIAGDPGRTAFWLNLYNALLVHRLLLEPVQGSILRQLRLFSQTAYEVGGAPYSLGVIEHALLRGNRRAPFTLRRPLRASDLRLAAAPAVPDPRVHFALNCGARSCPPVRVYGASDLDEQLEMATAGYLADTTALDGARIVLPRLMRIYAADFGTHAEQLRFVAGYSPKIAQRLEGRLPRPRVRYGRFDWTAAPGTRSGTVDR